MHQDTPPPSPVRTARESMLRNRLIGMMLAVTVIVTTSVAAVVGYWDYRTFQNDREHIGRAILHSLTPQLIRLTGTDNTDATSDITTTLRAFSDVRYLFAYDPAGESLYSYHRADRPALDAPDPSEQPGHAPAPGGMRLWSSFALQGGERATAMLDISADLRDDWLTTNLVPIAALIPLSLLLALGVSMGLQRRITRPIRFLTAAMQQVSTTGDFSLRVHTADRTEIGALYEGFNAMLVELANAEVLLQQHKRAIDHAAIVSITDVNGTITYANEKFCEISRYDRGELLGNTHRVVNSGHHPKQFFADMWGTIASGRVWKGEIRNRDKDGGHYWVDTTIVPILDKHGRPQQYVAIRFPITDRKQQELELVAAKETLETRVAERTEQLMQSRERLIEAERLAALGRLVAGIAHEINTPIGIGVTASSHLTDKLRELSTQIDANTLTRRQLTEFAETFREGNEIILGNLQRAATLVRSFKQVAADQSHHERRRFALAEYIDGILLSLRPALKHSPHIVEVDCPRDLEMDSYPGALSQILTNLITNSLRYAFEPGQVGRLHIAAEASGDNEIRLVYADDGRGIPQDDIKRVFEPFFTTGRHIGGTGLGLHIVHNLVHNTLHGELHCDSPPGGGTRFEFILPRVVAPSTAAAAGS